MARERAQTTLTACAQCRLGQLPGLNTQSDERARLIQQFKRGEFELDRGARMFEEGKPHPGFYTILAGALLRYRNAPDGGRQIVNVMFPGDIAGLQGLRGQPFQHVVEAILPVRLCRFDRRDLDGLIAADAHLGHDMIWIAAKEESALESHLVTLGRRRASMRIAYLACFLLDRSYETGLSAGPTETPLPVTQAQIADMLGLSHVHANRSLQKLRAEGLVEWDQRHIATHDLEALRAFAGYERPYLSPRPYV